MIFPTWIAVIIHEAGKEKGGMSLPVKAELGEGGMGKGDADYVPMNVIPRLREGEGREGAKPERLGILTWVFIFVTAHSIYVALASAGCSFFRKKSGVHLKSQNKSQRGGFFQHVQTLVKFLMLLDTS